MGKKRVDLTPEHRAAMAERAERLKWPSWQPDHLRRLAEKLGYPKDHLRQLGEKLNLPQKTETARPQEPAPRKRGRKASLTPDETKRGIGILRDQPRMTVEAARMTLRAAGIDGSGSALYRLIIAPAYGISK